MYFVFALYEGKTKYIMKIKYSAKDHISATAQIPWYQIIKILLSFSQVAPARRVRYDKADPTCGFWKTDA
jgi:hypothetical protein